MFDVGMNKLVEERELVGKMSALYIKVFHVRRIMKGRVEEREFVGKMSVLQI